MTSMPNNSELFKLAGAEAALVQLGLVAPSEQEKTAVVGLAKGLWSVGKGLWNLTGGKVMKGISSRLGQAGESALGHATKRWNLSDKTVGRVKDLTKGMAGETVLGAGLGGGINAALAEPGDRWSAFARGAAGGAIGGAMYSGASNAARMGITRAAGKHAPRLRALAGQTDDLSKTMIEAGKNAPWHKRWGAKALMGGVPFAAGMAAAWHEPHFGGGGGQAPTAQTGYNATPGQIGNRLAQGIPRAYNPNLPMGQ